MKIGILTQPLHNNYGGILQAYALQKILKDLGHEVLTVDLPFRKTYYQKTRELGGRIYRKYLLRQNNISIFHDHPSKKEQVIINQHIRKFINDNISLTEHIPFVEKIDRLKKYNFDVYVVGSDQVWRPRYSPGIPTFFLDFIENEYNIKKIAYAASFGTENWEMKSTLTVKCAKLLQQFNAVSVRELSGVELCKKYFGISASHVLDPTLLLQKKDYIDLIDKDNIPHRYKTLTLYLLDQTAEKKAIIENIHNHLHLEINSVMPERKYSKQNRKDIDKCVYPPVTQWIRGFLDAEFVITDSFHGTIFAILFNRPFITIGNKKRGMARFNSLLNFFNLTDRLILPGDEVDIEKIMKPINYTLIEEILFKEKEKSFLFLSGSLNS